MYIYCIFIFRGDFLIEAPIWRGFSIAMFEYQRVFALNPSKNGINRVIKGTYGVLATLQRVVVYKSET